MSKLFDYAVEIISQEPAEELQAKLNEYASRGYVLDKCWPTTISTQVTHPAALPFSAILGGNIQQLLPALYCIFARPTGAARKPWGREPWQGDEDE